MASAGAAGRDGGCGVVPAVASAAPPTPVSTTDCGGPLAIDPSPTTDDPYLVDYKFHCSEDITAYSLIVDRRASDFGTVDDFDPSPQVFDPTGAPSATAAVSCSGETPGNGINCNAGAGGVVSAMEQRPGVARPHRAVLQVPAVRCEAGDARRAPGRRESRSSRIRPALRTDRSGSISRRRAGRWPTTCRSRRSPRRRRSPSRRRPSRRRARRPRRPPARHVVTRSPSGDRSSPCGGILLT